MTHSPTSTIVCIATGPSLTLEQIAVARSKGFRLFGCNNVFRIVPDLELTYACNEEWWREYWHEIEKHPCSKWTTNERAAHRYGINWIAERWGEGLCTENGIIHHGHGSGFSLLSMAHKMGAARVVLLGYDMTYAPDYDGLARNRGSTPRHSTLLMSDGEYPDSLKHWPHVAVERGKHVELCRLYRTVADQALIEVINASPNSALDCFPKVSIDAV